MDKPSIQTGYFEILKQDFNVSIVPGTTQKLSVTCKIDISPELGKRMSKALLAAHRKMDEEVVKKLEDDYTPIDTGIMSQSYTVDKNNPGTITLTHPGARYLYYGREMKYFGTTEDGQPYETYFAPRGGSKQFTGNWIGYKNSHAKGHGKAGPLWFEYMKADCKDEIAEEAQKVLNDEMKNT